MSAEQSPRLLDAFRTLHPQFYAGRLPDASRRDDRFFIGNLDGRPNERAFLDPQAFGVHTFVLGVSGSGKTRYISYLLFDLIRRGQKIVLLDPVGGLFAAVRNFVGFLYRVFRDSPWFRRYYLDEFQERFYFVDFSDPGNPFRWNPLERMGEESIDETAGDLLTAIEDKIGSMLDMRRLLNVLNGLFRIGIELGLTLPEVRDMLQNTEFREACLRRAAPSDAKRYFEDFLLHFKGQELNSRLESAVNALNMLLNEPCIRNFCSAPNGNLDLAKIVNDPGKSLVVHLPVAASHHGAELMGTLLQTKVLRIAFRRTPEQRKRRLHLVTDESHLFVSDYISKAYSIVRNYGVSMVYSGQFARQIPLNTPEGEGKINNIISNCKLRILFRLDRADAESFAKRVQLVDFRRLKMVVEDVAVSRTQTRSEGTSRSRGESRGETSTQTWSVTMTEGTSQSHGGTNSRGESSSVGTSDGKTFGIGLLADEDRPSSRQAVSTLGSGLTITTGSSYAAGASQSRGESSGGSRGETFTVTQTDGKTVTVGNSDGRTVTARNVFWTLEEQREEFIQKHFLFSPTRLALFALSDGLALRVETPFVPDRFPVVTPDGKTDYEAAYLEQSCRRAGLLRVEPAPEAPGAPEVKGMAVAAEDQSAEAGASGTRKRKRTNL